MHPKSKIPVTVIFILHACTLRACSDLQVESYRVAGPLVDTLYSFTCRKREFCNVYRSHVYRDRVGGEGGFLENTIRTSLPKGLPLGFGEICVDLWDFERGDPEAECCLWIKDLSVARHQAWRSAGKAVMLRIHELSLIHI